MPFVLYLTPLFGALIGWLAALLALTLLVKPRRPASFGFITIQGLIPKYAKQIALQLASSLSHDFSIESWLKEQLASPDIQHKVATLLNERLDDLVSSLRSQIPMGEMFLTGALADKLKQQATNELMKMLPDIPHALAAHISLQNVVGSLLDKPLNSYKQEQIEASIKQIVLHDLMRLTYFGAALGFLIGLIQLVVVATLI